MNVKFNCQKRVSKSILHQVRPKVKKYYLSWPKVGGTCLVLRYFKMAKVFENQTPFIIWQLLLTAKMLSKLDFDVLKTLQPARSLRGHHFLQIWDHDTLLTAALSMMINRKNATTNCTFLVINCTLVVNSWEERLKITSK